MKFKIYESKDMVRVTVPKIINCKYLNSAKSRSLIEQKSKDTDLVIENEEGEIVSFKLSCDEKWEDLI